MITIYHLSASRSERIVWLMEELGPEYRLEASQREPNGAPPKMLAFVDAELADGPYFAGPQFTAADVMMAFPFTTMRQFIEYDLAPYANILAYLKRIESRPAYRKAMALAGP